MKQYPLGKNQFRNHAVRYLIFVVAWVMLLCPNVQALSLYDGEEFTARLDTTVSAGVMFRVQDQDKDIIGIANGGTFNSVNYDDGNLNYDTGLISSALKVTSELELDRKWIGAFIRGTGFYDYENKEEDRERTELTDDAEDAVGSDITLLDAYVWTAFEIADMPVQVRIGEQVVSWGESTFIQNSINSINPIDVSKIRVPGAELKEALVPEGMVWTSVSVTDAFSVEGLYLYDWEETKIDEPGTYFGTNDFAGDGGRKLMLGFGAAPDMGNAPASDTLLAVPRDSTPDTDDQGQFGIALRYFAEELNDTEISLYYLKYNSRLPNLSARTGTEDGANLIAPTAAATFGFLVGNGVDPAEALVIAENVGLNEYTKTAGYLTEYVEDIQLFGLGFNTEAGGWGVQGEVSYRKDQPLQIDDLELLTSLLGPLDPTPTGIGYYSQIGPQTDFDQNFKGYIEKDVTQIQMTVSKLLSPIFGADGGVILGEVGYLRVLDMPNKGDLRLEGPGTVTSGDAFVASQFNTPAQDSKYFADASSGGYRLMAQLDYFNAIGAISMSPRIAFAHDIIGNSYFGGPFQKDLKAVTLGLGMGYRSWSSDISYTNYFGVESHNMMNDRDFIGCNVKYSF